MSPCLWVYHTLGSWRHRQSSKPETPILQVGPLHAAGAVLLAGAAGFWGLGF